MNLDLTTLVNDGEWHHVAVIKDDTGRRIYVDGVERKEEDQE